VPQGHEGANPNEKGTAKDRRGGQDNNKKQVTGINRSGKVEKKKKRAKQKEYHTRSQRLMGDEKGIDRGKSGGVRVGETGQPQKVDMERRRTRMSGDGKVGMGGRATRGSEVNREQQSRGEEEKVVKERRVTKRKR